VEAWPGVGHVLDLLGAREMGRCDKFSEDEVESGVRSTSADTLSDQPLSEWPVGREADRTLAQRTAAVGLTGRGSLSEVALMADSRCALPTTMVRTSAVRGEASLVVCLSFG
jgi:hypothetical protein